MKLCNLVEIIHNDETSLIMKVMDDKRMELIRLGYFEGNEEIIRVTKGEKNIYTVFTRDDKYYDLSPSAFENDSRREKRKLIWDCITDDFDIYMGKDKEKINRSMYIYSLADKKDNEHDFRIFYHIFENGKVYSDYYPVVVHKDGEPYARFKMSVQEVKNILNERGYALTPMDSYRSSTGAYVEGYRSSFTEDSLADTLKYDETVEDEVLEID